MTLTRGHRETVQDRIRRDPQYRQLLLAGAVARLLEGEIGVARIRMRDYVVAIVGLERPGAMTDASPRHLERTFGAEGAPRAGDLFETIVLLAQQEGVHLELGAYLERFGEETSPWRHVRRLFRSVGAWRRDFRQRKHRRREGVLTLDYHEGVQERIRRDRKSRKHVLIGCVEHLILGEIGLARIRMRDYIIGAVGFERLGAMTGESPQCLEHLFGDEGGPRAGDLFETIVLLAQHEGVHLELGAYMEKFAGVDEAEA